MVNAILPVILARGGSKRLPNKNILPFGKDKGPLISITIKQCIEVFGECWVNTDSKEIEKIALKHLAEAYRRPDNLGLDDVQSIDVLKEMMLHFPQRQAIILLQCTSPLRTKETILKCLQQYALTKNTIASGWEKPDGQVYIYNAKNINDRYEIVRVTPTVDIDTATDFQIAEILYDTH